MGFTQRAHRVIVPRLLGELAQGFINKCPQVRLSFRLVDYY